MIAAAGEPGGFCAYDEMEHTDAGAVLRRMIHTFQRAGVEDIVIVTGYKARETEKNLTRLGVAFLRCEDYQNVQMIDFAVKGFRYLKKCGRIFFCPADVPLFTKDTLVRMMEKTAPVVIPVCKGRKGHPVLIDSRLTESIAEYKGERGLKGALDAAGEKVELLEVDDEGTIIQAGKEKDFENIINNDKETKIYAKVKVQLIRDKAFFGPGMMVLLKQIDLLGNVREACEKAGMSYSKGWSLIRTAEAELGAQVVERCAGGKTGGAARISIYGRELMKRYEQLDREISEFAECRYRDLFCNDQS